MAVYAIAFVFYAVDFANASAEANAAALDQEPDATTAVTAAASVVSTSSNAKTGLRRRSAPLRIGFSLTVLAFLLHLTATVLRGVGAGRLPYGNMYEFALTATLSIVLIFLIVQFFTDLRFLGALVTGMALLFLGVTRTNFYVPIVPLQAALDSYWLVIHISVAVLSVGFLTLSFGLSVLQLMQQKRERLLDGGTKPGRSFLAVVPKAVRMEDLAYRLAIIGFIFWSFTLVAGAIWAERAWTRYWGWDVKEVWTFIIWVLYAGYIHARATRGWRGTRSAWLNITAYGTVIFNFVIVNVYFSGLHSYSGL